MKIISLIFFVALCQLAGIIGSFFTASSIKTWYVLLDKPSFNPPGWIFGPVWIILYTLMGVSAFLIWQRRFEIKQAWPAIILFLVHLAFNTAWSIIFFGLKSPFGGFIIIIILLTMITALIVIFYRINKTASFLLLPYLLWVSFATILNYNIWKLNA